MTLCLNLNTNEFDKLQLKYSLLQLKKYFTLF